MTPERSGRPECPGPGSGHLLAVVLDDWAAPPEPLPDREFFDLRRQEWRLNALISARVAIPSALCIVSGV